MVSLEPIEESDLNLHGKFVGEAEKEVVPIERVEDSGTGTFVLEEISTPAEQEIEKEGQAGFDKILSKIPNGNVVLSSVSAAAVQDDVKQVSEMDTVQAKIDTLVKIATTKGVVHAVEVARKTQDNYTLDELHDKLLATDLHDALIKNGLLKEL
jgi:hypothetical protein